MILQGFRVEAGKVFDCIYNGRNRIVRVESIDKCADGSNIVRVFDQTSNGYRSFDPRKMDIVCETR